MSYVTIEHLLGLDNDKRVLNDNEVETPPVKPHELEGQLVSKLDVLYLSSLEKCGFFDYVVCADTRVEPATDAKRLFGIREDTASVEKTTEESEKYGLHVTIALGLDEGSSVKTGHITVTMNNVIADFGIRSVNGDISQEREIVQKIIKKDHPVEVKSYNDDPNVFSDYETVIKMVESIDNKEWEKSSNCKNCPVVLLGLRKVKNTDQAVTVTE